MTSSFSLPFIVLFIYLFIVFSGQCPAQTQNNSLSAAVDQINNLENQLFFRQYIDENESVRLSRIENYIFGQQYNDSVENRIARIQTAVTSRKSNEGGSITSTPAQNLGGQPGDPMPAQNNIPATRTNNGDDIEAPDRQLQVQQARANQVNTLLYQAVSLYRHKQFKEAIEIFQQVIRLDPQNASAHFSMGIALQANNNLAQAASEYDQAIALEPDNKEYQLASQNLKSAIEQQNQSKTEDLQTQTLASQAADDLKNGQYDQAIAMYDQLIEKNPHQALYQYNVGTAYLMLKRPQDALPYYKNAHKLDSANKVYGDSLQKLELSLKEIKDEKEKVAKQNSPVKMDLYANFGLEVKQSRLGVMVKKLKPGWRAAQVGLSPEDIIKTVDGVPITQVSQLEQILASKSIGQRFQFAIIRRGMACQLSF